MIRLIALDLDGTLLDPAGQVTQATRDAVAAARAAGVRVVLSTGRAVPEAVRYIREAGCDKLAVCLGGGVLADGETGYHIRRWDIPPASALPALELCLGRNIQLMVFAGEEILLDPYSRDCLLQTFPSPAFHESAIVTENPADYLRRHDLPLTKLHGDGDPASYPLKELSALEGKLAQWEASPEETEALCGRLEELGYLDDARYGAMVARHYSRKGYGPAKIREELYRRGVPRELWDDAVAEMEDTDQALDAFLDKKLKGGPLPDDPRERKRLTDACARRGFSWQDISQAMARRGGGWED